jgi:hypothetical protein
MMADYLIIAPLIVGLAVGLYEFLTFSSSLMGMNSQKIFFFFQAFLFGSVFAFCSINSAFVITAFGLSSIPLLGTAIGLQVIAGVLAAVVAILVLLLMTMSGGGMMGFGSKVLFSIGIAAIVFAAPYLAPLLSGITGGR